MAMEKFKLTVYNENLKKFLYQEYDSLDSPYDLCTDTFMNKSVSLNIPYTYEARMNPGFLKQCIELRYLRGDWLRFREFIGMRSGYFVFRGVSNYNWFSLRRLMKWGNDRYTDDGLPKSMMYKTETSTQQSIWGDDSMSKAWEHARHGHPREALLLLYDKRKLKQTEHCVWTLRPGVKDFHEALVAVVRVFFR